ncbi:T9SS type A sorting domain-containing protein [Polaribacter marinivivus]|uniref:T9SS type A sorting domain-containing protein n=1 Tax=Polaribacter marinivivus TaxID=1524260 RepID=UPI003D34CFA8
MAYILVSDLITDNSTNLDASHQAVYIWDNNKVGGAGYSALAGTDYIYPGQGFFVNAANSTAGNFTIDKTKLSHQTGQTLYKNAKPSIQLMVADGSELKYTEIEYLEGKTLGLDPSFDIGTFTATSTSFSIYTQLVSQNEGVDFMRQALPNTNFENTVIPVGINAEAGKEITFTANAQNLPLNIKVFLEDRTENTFTQLDMANSSYKVTLNEALNGVGRFYLHTKSSVLSTDSAQLENVSIYKTNDTTLRITGLQQGNTTIQLFNVLGKRIMISSFNSDGVSDVYLPKLATGMYIVKLETVAGKLNRKIVLE